jgi:hypothetical protein
MLLVRTNDGECSMPTFKEDPAAYMRAFEARQTAPVQAAVAAHPQTPPAAIAKPQAASPGRALAVDQPPLHGEVIAPRSMIADGGTPPRRYPQDASVAEATALIRAYAAEQARINAETARRLAALERHVALEERNKATKAAGVAKWAEAQRLFFAMLRP